MGQREADGRSSLPCDGRIPRFRAAAGQNGELAVRVLEHGPIGRPKRGSFPRMRVALAAVATLPAGRFVRIETLRQCSL
jgi:hypothetical protein